MTTAGDALPIQPAARPEAASARKDVSVTDDQAGVSFAEVLDAETDAATNEIPAAAVTAQPVPPAVPPAAPEITPQTTALGTILAALQTINAEPAADAANTVAPGEKTSGAAAASVAAPDAGALIAQPQVQADATAQVSLVAAGVAVAPAAAKAAKIADGTAAIDGADGADGAKPEGEAADPAATANALVQSVIAAPTAAGAAPVAIAIPTTEASTIAGDVAAAAAPKVAAEKADAPLVADASSSDTSTSTGDAKINQPAATATASAPKSSVQTNAQAEAASAGASGPDAKADVAQASANTSTTTSTSMADALTARGPTTETGAAKAAPAMANAPAAVAQVYARFIERHDGRAQRFEIRLDPAELGRVDVRIEVGADKKVHAVLAAHDSAALGDLMKGQRALEQALGDAGIDLADGGLKFELSQDSGRGLADSQQHNGTGHGRENSNVWRGFSALDIPVDTNAADLAGATRTYRRAAARLDVMA